MRPSIPLAVLVAISVPAGARSTCALTFEVGPGKTLANVGDVPWESLNPGDTVLLHRPQRSGGELPQQRLDDLPGVRGEHHRAQLRAARLWQRVLRLLQRPGRHAQRARGRELYLR